MEPAKHHQIATTRAPVIIAIVLTVPFYPLHHYIAKKTHSACTGVVLDTTKFPTTVILEQAMLEMNMTDLVGVNILELNWSERQLVFKSVDLTSEGY